MSQYGYGNTDLGFNYGTHTHIFNVQKMLHQITLSFCLSFSVFQFLQHESRNKEQSIANLAEKNPMTLVGIEPGLPGQ